AALMPHKRLLMYITDATHFLDANGAIGPKDGYGRKMAEFFGSVIVAATLTETGTSDHVPKCIRCGGAVSSVVGVSGAIEWKCGACATEGRLSNWRNTLWDLTPICNGSQTEH
ncbi:hypothetical protein B2A_11604, partial [mine drainage metagenome]